MWKHVNQNVSVYEADNRFLDLQHMTNREDWCVSSTEARSRTKTFVIGNRRSNVVEGHGNVQLKLANGKKFIFRNVIYIPVYMVCFLSRS